ncbi:DNA recombination protein RmuC [Frankia sp. Ag45/Mut15]|uniref:DNA recombination protein RmuC n=1 Tax=Frankia umida TaxID=573489 RepID=A0ABT0K0A8_9ACTN|nr:DNA recombination protein RmuC [Frankia umida]MCK9877161.1 DNA recombination protein RmuC [Frankia umida]
MDTTSALLTLVGLVLGAVGGFLAARALADPRHAALSGAHATVLRERDEARAANAAALERAQLAEADVSGLRTALEYEKRSAGERVALVEQSQQRLAESFQALSAQALAGASQQLVELATARFDEAGARARGDLDARRAAVESMVSPLADALGRMEGRLRELETARTEAYASLVEQVRFAREASENLRTQTAALVTVLRRPQARGAWGEMQLRRVAEVAGMLNRCDFTEQLTVQGDDGPLRPDMVVHLAGGRNVAVDAKVPLAAFLDAAESTDERFRTERMAAHARHLRTHVDGLSAKSYWRALPSSPEFVVLFVPAEAFLAPALDHDPGLLEHAAARKVIIATPTTLIAMLRTIAYAWTQEALTTRTREIFELGRDLYTRLGTLGEHLDRLGRSLGRAVGEFNATVGSLESRVLTPARRLAAMNVVEGALPSPGPVETGVRPLSAAELLPDGQRISETGRLADTRQTDIKDKGPERLLDHDTKQ